MDEAVTTIDILENQLQEEKEKHKEEIQILEQKIFEAENNVGFSNEALIKTNLLHNKVKRLRSEAIGLVILNI